MTMARGHSCRSRFEEFSAAIANWCSFMKFNPASYDIFIDVLFCQVQQVQWISELQIGAPDFNGCYMSRSPLQSFLEVHRDFRCVLVMINAARFIETSCFGVHPYL